MVKPFDIIVTTDLAYLREQASKIGNDTLALLCRRVLEDQRFQTCTASRERHQAYKGGLLVHTAEVMRVALAMASAHGTKANLDVIRTAIIFHDYGKIHDYAITKEGKYEYLPHQSLLRHLSSSYGMFVEQLALATGQKREDFLGNEMKMAIEHCILAHHGRKEWGSPVEPQTVEAYIVHCAGQMSASFDLT